MSKRTNSSKIMALKRRRLLFGKATKRNYSSAPSKWRTFSGPSQYLSFVALFCSLDHFTMSNVSSPTRFSGIEDRFYDHIDISEKMRVPKRIKVSGDHENVETVAKPSPWDDEKFDMKVPDRILVVGQDQYYGTTAPPREVVLENTVMPPDPGMIRVQTPPRVITLSEHYFPTVEDEDELIDRESGATSEKSLSSANLSQNKVIVPTNQWSSVPTLNGSGENSQKSLLPTEEMSHLRSQMAKLNRRLMALELDNIQRQQRERYLLALGLGYFLVKFVIWLNK